MRNYRFILEPYKGIKTRYKCPSCNKKGQFTRYIDIQNNEYINENVGICNRVSKCGYHYTPKQFFSDNALLNLCKNKQFKKNNDKPRQSSISFINKTFFSNSFTTKNPNYFLDYLTAIWGADMSCFLANKYNIGTSTHWKGATIFWQEDILGQIRTGKIMLYDSCSGKRVKKPYNHINWMHNVLRLEGFNLGQCLFGEHLLRSDKTKPVAIVESEKTAIIASVFLPEFIWLACGSVNNLNIEKTKVLKGRSVVLFPDLGCYDLWSKKTKQLSKLTVYRISKLLEDNATEKEKKQGLDIADYLVSINY